jgi:hypothetical protein
MKVGTHPYPPLPRTEVGTALGKQGVVPLRQPQIEVVGIGFLGCSDAIHITCICPRVF